ncbi:MAG: pilus assembly protein TadG-related protein [Chloroflexi bacterium]|nr:pilus assembly protein TadG-related protein [Chloroflexota bacterium]
MAVRAGRTSLRERGQVIVVFALAITGLLAAAGLAFDIGRFYSERRFLQNAADSAALAAANSIIRGDNTILAESIARDVLTRNFLGDPNGRPPALPPSTPVYESGHAGDADYLIDGILISGGNIRVAVRNTIDYTFGRFIGLVASEVGARARVELLGDLLPIAVRRYVSPPGPEAGAAWPCPDNQTKFTDFFATADTACLGSETDSSLRVDPSAGDPFDVLDPGSDPVHHGPVVAILGQGAQPNNGADFRGFVALDIRNFATTTSRSYYNGVTASTNSNTLKAMEANWVAVGYPGPAFPPAVTPPDPNDQVGIMSGNATGIAIDAVNNRFAPGDVILVAIYPGNVMAIPDFAIAPPAQISLPTSGTMASAGSLKVSRNQAFSGNVTLTMLGDGADPANPAVLGTLTSPYATFDPQPVWPSLGGGTAVDIENMTTSGATPGIYALWIQGDASAPFLTTKTEPVALKIGAVTRDFTMTSDSQSLDTAAIGDSVTFTLTLTNSPNKNTAFGNPVTLSVDSPTPAGGGPITFGSTTVTPTKPGASTTLTINTGTLPQGGYEYVVRATGMNGDSTSLKVTHLLKLTVNVTPSSGSGSDDYVDIVGFAAMRIASGDSNAIYAYAITPLVADMNDPRLSQGQVARLVPWD